MAWIGILGEDGRLRKELYVVRGIALYREAERKL